MKKAFGFIFSDKDFLRLYDKLRPHYDDLAEIQKLQKNGKTLSNYTALPNLFSFKIIISGFPQLINYIVNWVKRKK